MAQPLPLPLSTPTLSSFEEPIDDYITDIKYDFYGRRTVTTWAHGLVRIRDIDESGKWVVSEGCELKATHAGVLWKADWAHPEFGQILATCSQDRTVKIWVSKRYGKEEFARIERSGFPRGGAPRWHCVSNLAESRDGVCDVKFAPRHFGLRVAAASEDGTVRMYRVNDPSDVGKYIQEKSFTPCKENSGVTCISWCNSPFEAPSIAVGTRSGLVQLWTNDGSADEFGTWSKVLDLQGHRSRLVTSIDWATCNGRKHHRIATCGGDGQLQVHRVTSPRKHGGSEWRDEESQQLYDGMKAEAGVTAWQVHWDMAGSTLTTSGDDGAIRVWAMDFDRVWCCVDTLYEPSWDRQAVREAIGLVAGQLLGQAGAFEEG